MTHLSAPRLPWFIKYRPKTLEEYVDQEEAKAKLIEWLKSWEKGPPPKRAVLLHGPPGCGKTTLVEVLARSFGYQLFELNASDTRRKEDIENVVASASKTGGLTARRKMILLDEVDGMATKADAGGVEAVVHVVSKTRVPIVMTANNAYVEALRPVREVAELVPLKRLTEKNIIIVLKRICEAEKLSCDDAALREIAVRAEGDLRSAINDLEAVASAGRRVTVDLVKSVLPYRDRVYAPYEALRKLFDAKYVFQARDAVTSTELSPDEFMIWVNEHIPTHYESLEEIYRAYEALSRADVYVGRIIKTQNWDLLSYALDMMGPGVAFARKEYKYKWKAYKSPERLKLLAESRRARETREKLAEHLASHLSTSKATVKQDVIPYLRLIFTHNPKLAAKIAKAYSLSEDEIKFLAGPKAQEVINHIARTKTTK